MATYFNARGCFGLNTNERADREPASGMALQVLDVGSGTGGRFLQSLHRAVAVLAAHELVALRKRFVEGAWQPTAAYFDFALRHHGRFLLRRHVF